ncbi:MAG: hypothetical protein KatS3mg001_224 [Candidatus Pacearchaeota archaeon]|nr:MAG: hypothetical protein KatS3mg001_224 [Candidatus Pacearchaeota archaeon]
MAKKKEENPIHIRFEYFDSLRMRKNILILEELILKMTKRVNFYFSERQKELNLKMLLYKKFKDLKSLLNSSQKRLPNIKDQKIFFEESLGYQKEEKEEIIKKGKKELSIEEQLKEIQRKLEELQKQGV